MITLIYLTVFFSSAIIFNTIITATVERWRDWQAKRVARAVTAMDESFIFLEKKKLELIALFPVICAAAVFLAMKNLFGLIIGFLIGLALPVILIKTAKQARIRKFSGQLVDCLMILSSSLKSGLSFTQAMDVLCEEMPAPASEEFGLVLKQNRLGVTLEDALLTLRARMPLEEINLIVSSILVAKGTGGELTRVFNRLIETIRSNIKLKAKVATLTLQGRLQGIIMAILPIGFTIFIYKQNPHHFDAMFQTQLGRNLIILAVVLQVVGMYLIKRISTLRM